MPKLEWMQNLRIKEINLVNTYTKYRSDYPMKNKGRKHCGFLYTIEGEETYIFGDRSITATPNTVLFVPRGEKYTIELSGEKSVVIVLTLKSIILRP